MNRMLIDTNIYSHALRGTADVVEVLRGANLIAVSAISIGELLPGFKGGKREKQNRKEPAQFLDSPRVRLFSIFDYDYFWTDFVNCTPKRRMRFQIVTRDTPSNSAALDWLPPVVSSASINSRRLISSRLNPVFLPASGAGPAVLPLMAGGRCWGVMMPS